VTAGQLVTEVLVVSKGRANVGFGYSCANGFPLRVICICLQMTC